MIFVSVALSGLRPDGAREWSRRASKMQKLSAAQKQNLVEIINEDFGTGLIFDEFAEVVLDIFEDISGFETIPPAKVKLLINQLWRKYHVQKST
jgi:hypothetical protein